MYKYLEIIKDDAITTVRLNRAEKKNALNDEMGDELVQAVSEINQDLSTRITILTGAGDVFSAGGDLEMISMLQSKNKAESAAFMRAYYRKFFSLRQLTMPSIAMINGHAIGAGLCLALACDMRTMAEDAKTGVTFVNIGLNAGMGGTYTLPWLIGLGRAAELLFTGKLVSAQKAHEFGLVNHVFSRETLEQETRKIALTIAENAPLALRYTKRSLYEGMSGNLEKTFFLEAEGQGVCYESHDLTEGVTAKQAKRKPNFSGN